MSNTKINVSIGKLFFGTIMLVLFIWAWFGDPMFTELPKVIWGLSIEELFRVILRIKSVIAFLWIGFVTTCLIFAIKYN